MPFGLWIQSLIWSLGLDSILLRCPRIFSVHSHLDGDDLKCASDLVQKPLSASSMHSLPQSFCSHLDCDAPNSGGSRGGKSGHGPPSKFAMEFVNLSKCKDFGPPRIDVGYGFGPPVGKYHIKTWKRLMTKKKIHQKFWEIDQKVWEIDNFGGKCWNFWRNA